MMTKTIFPSRGELLRNLITRAGYRNHLTDVGLDKDLDDLANESRPGSSCDLMVAVEDACRKETAKDCGLEWAEFFSIAWVRAQDALLQMVRNLDTSAITDEQGKEDVTRVFVVPMLSGFLRLVTSKYPGPDIDLWWQSPVAAWIDYAAIRTATAKVDLLTNLGNHLNVDPRSIERWMAGEPTGKLCWPYRPTVVAAVGHAAERRLSVGEIDQLAGWLILAVAYQSLPVELRGRIRQDFVLRPQQPWSVEYAIAALTKQSLVRGDRPVRALAIPLLQQVEALFARKPRDVISVRRVLDEFQSLIDREIPVWQRAYRYLHRWYSARLAALSGHETEALKLYMEAVEGVWWYGGQNQHPIINEALLYAVGVGKKNAAEHLWDKSFLLGLNRWPKRPLDEQELRRLAFGFEKMFSPQKAKDRIPPPIEFVVRDEPFSLSPKQLGAPNRKVKFADGRTRRTPLMDAIREGSLADVKQAIEAGGNPNDYISESGEGPLSYAMRRACDRKDPAIMDYLLGLDLLPETVNRAASTKRETPLKIAIEMANATALERLIKLGADIEAPSDYVPSALCYAMLLLHQSLHREDRTQELGYLEGKGRADVYDAKDGAVMDADLAARRQALILMRDSSERNRAIFDEVMDYFIRPPQDHREVIRVLLNCGADANRRYKVNAHDVAEWTPTLFAAEVGDLKVFKSLVEAGGDPNLTLMQTSSLQQFDALWVAVAHGRHAIVAYLIELQSTQHRANYS